MHHAKDKICNSLFVSIIYFMIISSNAYADQNVVVRHTFDTEINVKIMKDGSLEGDEFFSVNLFRKDKKGLRCDKIQKVEALFKGVHTRDYYGSRWRSETKIINGRLGLCAFSKKMFKPVWQLAGLPFGLIDQNRLDSDGNYSYPTKEYVSEYLLAKACKTSTGKTRTGFSANVRMEFYHHYTNTGVFKQKNTVSKRIDRYEDNQNNELYVVKINYSCEGEGRNNSSGLQSPRSSDADNSNKSSADNNHSNDQDAKPKRARTKAKSARAKFKKRAGTRDKSARAKVKRAMTEAEKAKARDNAARNKVNRICRKQRKLLKRKTVNGEHHYYCAAPKRR